MTSATARWRAINQAQLIPNGEFQMAYGDANVSRLGQIGQSGDPLALFLKVFSGEVLTAFEQAQLMMDKHRIRTIANGSL